VLKNTQTSYGLVTRILHWTMAILIISIIAVGFYMTNLPTSADKWYIYFMHKSTGLLILALVVCRIIWRFSNVWPPLPEGAPVWKKFAASSSVLLLYCMMLIMALSGFLGSLLGGHDVPFFGLFNVPAMTQNKELSGYLWSVHTTMPYFLAATIALHFLAAMHHHFIVGDNVLRRMWKGW
jgi:cytochrome b561